MYGSDCVNPHGHSQTVPDDRLDTDAGVNSGDGPVAMDFAEVALQAVLAYRQHWHEHSRCKRTLSEFSVIDQLPAE